MGVNENFIFQYFSVKRQVNFQCSDFESLARKIYWSNTNWTALPCADQSASALTWINQRFISPKEKFKAITTVVSPKLFWVENLVLERSQPQKSCWIIFNNSKMVKIWPVIKQHFVRLFYNRDNTTYLFVYCMKVKLFWTPRTQHCTVWNKNWNHSGKYFMTQNVSRILKLLKIFTDN